MNDDVDMGQLLASSLEPELELHVASSAEQACDLLKGLRRVDLAFLDLDLPGGSTDELLERLARWPNAIRVLLATALCDISAGDRSSYGRALNGQTLKHRHLAHLVISKPLALPVVQALKSMVLDLPGA